MMHHHLVRCAQLLTAAVVTVVAASATAQSWPDHPVRLIVPFPPGGGSDAVGRVIAQKLTQRLGQQVIVENKGGAGGSLGTEVAVRAAPDGYTYLLSSTSEVAVNPHLYKLSYDTSKDLTPVALVATTPLIVLAKKDLPTDSVQDLIALAKAKPGSINFASAGNGTISHLAGELFSSLTRVKWTHVPYKGLGPALQDLGGGQVDIVFSTPPPALGLVKADKAKILATTGRERANTMSDVPTVKEAAKVDYVVDNWYGIYAPTGTPKEVLDKLSEEVLQSLKSPDVISTLQTQGASPGKMTRAQFVDYTRTEIDKWRELVKATNVKIQ